MTVRFINTQDKEHILCQPNGKAAAAAGKIGTEFGIESTPLTFERYMNTSKNEIKHTF